MCSIIIKKNTSTGMTGHKPYPPINPPSPNSPAQDKKKSLRPWSIAMIAASAALVPVLVIIVFLCYYRMLQRKESKAEVIAEKRKNASNSNSAKDLERLRHLSESPTTFPNAHTPCN